MPVQPATRRLLTEQSAADALPSATHPLGVAANARFERLERRGQPDGYAPLGPDGRVPAAHVPGGPLIGRLLGAAVSGTGPATSAAARQTVAAITGLVPGSYEVEMVGTGYTGSATNVQLLGLLQPTDGLVAANSAGAATNVPTAGQSSRIAGFVMAATGGPVSSEWAVWSQNTTFSVSVAVLRATGVGAFRLRMLLVVTTGGGLRWLADHNAGGVAWYIEPGAYLSATKVA